MFATRARYLLAAAAALTFATTAAHASSVTWDGHTWNGTFGSAVVDSSNNVDITASTPSSGTYYGDIHYNTDTAFRAAPTPYLKATFSDPGGTDNAGFLAFEQESGTGKSWAEIGVDPTNGPGSDSHYSLYWWNEATNVTDELILGARSAGDHTFELGRRADGTVDFYLDGSLALSTNSITPAYFGDVYLFSASPNSGSVATFTDFVSGTDYTVAPLPAAAPAAALLLAGLLITPQLRRRRQPLA